MTSRERVLAALRCEEPDRISYCELGIDRALARQLLSWEGPESHGFNIDKNQYEVEEMLAIADCLRLDNLGYSLRAPIFAEKHPGKDGRLFYGDGQIRTKADLDRVRLPDPHSHNLYANAESCLSSKGDYASWFITRIGIFPALLSMGIEHFSTSLHDDRYLVESLPDRYVDWVTVVADHACRLGFKVFVSTDDIAFNTAPYFSPKVFHDLVLPLYERVAGKITLPWIIRSDGNMMPFVDDLMSLGISVMHPIEKGAMDIRAMKQSYAGRLCLLGNVDLNLLGMATSADVDAEVRDLIHDVGPGGGYIVTSGDSLAGYLIPENVRAMSDAVLKYGKYRIAA